MLTELPKAVTRSENGAIYYPRIKAPDPLRENRSDTFVPCGAVAGSLSPAPTPRAASGRRPPASTPALNGVPDLQRQPDRRARTAQLNPLGINCLRTFPVDGPRRLGRAHAATAPTALRRRVEVRPGPPARAVHRGEPLPRHPMGGLRAQRRAAVGADPAQRRRLHARPVPPGRVPGHDARARPTSSSATARPPRRTTSTSASSTSWSASRR